MTTALIVAVAALVGITLVVERSHAAWRVVPKAAASAGFVALAVASGAADTPYGRWVLVALALGSLGDIALALDRPAWFTAGLAVFLLSHLAYIGAFQALGLRAIATAVTLGVLAVAATAVGRWLLPHVPRKMQAPVVAYVVVITVMVAAAAGSASNRAPWVVFPAALLFYVSDLMVSREEFVTPGFANRVVGLPLYYTAQVLLALSTGMI